MEFFGFGFSTGLLPLAVAALLLPALGVALRPNRLLLIFSRMVWTLSSYFIETSKS